MALDKRFFRPLGFLSIFAASPMIDAGLQALGPWYRHSHYLRLSLTLVSMFGSLLLLLAGILLCTKLPIGRTLVYWGTGISIPVYIFSAFIHMIGAHALLYGVGYPIAIVTLLHRATPSNGVPRTMEDSEAPPSRTRQNDGQLRSAIA